MEITTRPSSVVKRQTMTMLNGPKDQNVQRLSEKSGVWREAQAYNVVLPAENDEGDR